MKNSDIIKTLVNNYLSIEEDSKGQEIVFDEKFYHTPEGFNKQTLNNVDEKGIDFILIGDNPGKQEKKHNQYFYKKGNAGRYAHTFLDIASYYHTFGDRPFSYLIFNKTPFYSNTTDKLNIDDAVIKTCEFLIEALSKFSKTNPNLVILVVGRYKKNDLNNHFFKLLHNQIKEDFSLNQKIRFGNHFRNGHFFDQWLRNDWIGVKSIDGSSFHSTLNRIHEETYPKINSDFKLEFMKEDIISNLNTTLYQIANEYKNNLVVLNYDRLGILIDILSNYSDMVLLLSEEIERNVIEFLEFDSEQLEDFRNLQILADKLIIQKKQFVQGKDFEKASHIRDQLKIAVDNIYQEVVRLNGFQEGFNSYK